MANSHSETVQYFGLQCPDYGTFYICEGSDNEFIGCCTSNPCADGGGQCPGGHLRTASFASDKFDDLKKQSCDDTRAASVWWVCPHTDPPFLGCCDISPCGEGCSRKNLLPAVLSKNKENRQAFLDPEGYASSKSASAAISTASSSSSATSDDNVGLGTGAIVGIAIGSAAIGVILMGFLIWICWRYQRKRKQTGEKLQPVEPQVTQASSLRASDPSQSPMSYERASFPSTATVISHYPSGLSMDHHNKPSPPLATSNQRFSTDTSPNVNSIPGRSYGQSSSPVLMTTVQEMDGADTSPQSPQELSTDHAEENHQGQSQSPAMDQISPQN